MSITATRTALGDIAVVGFRGAGAAPTVARLRRALGDTLATRPQALIVNLTGVELDAETAAELLHGVGVARVQGCHVALCGTSESTREIICSTPAGRRVWVFDTVEDATQGLLIASI